MAPEPMAAPNTRLAAPPRAVLFDLDGTLADTAEDLAAPVNAMRAERGLEPLPLASLRPFASMGARGLIWRALGVSREDPAFGALRDEFLARYEKAMCVHTRLFPGMLEVLDEFERRGILWGVVSNKYERYVRPILAYLELGDRSVCAVGGDTTEFSKPHPAPLLLGARLAGVEPSACVYVGDDLRDVEAGRAAQMVTVAVTYGFSGDAHPPALWGADFLIDAPGDLLALLPAALPDQA